ncbi:MAG: hypothetical protein CMK32_07255 [Porticoccaceae bacterium]|nr:hypothetical protein [Porticoccaceae bacterium]
MKLSRPALDTGGWSRIGYCLCAVLGLVAVVMVVGLVADLRTPPGYPLIRFPDSGSDARPPIAGLFGDGSDPAEGSEQLPVARVGAVVVGVVTVGDRALASIAVDGAGDRLYAEGDALASGVEVAAIEPGLVIVHEQGQRRKLLLKSLLSAGGDPLLFDTPATASETARDDGIGLSSVVGPDGGLALKVDRIDGLQAVADGFETGDLITAVNGSPLADWLAAGHDPDSLGGGILTVTVNRAGRPTTIELAADDVLPWLSRF